MATLIPYLLVMTCVCSISAVHGKPHHSDSQLASKIRDVLLQWYEDFGEEDSLDKLPSKESTAGRVDNGMKENAYRLDPSRDSSNIENTTGTTAAMPSLLPGFEKAKALVLARLCQAAYSDPEQRLAYLRNNHGISLANFRNLDENVEDANGFMGIDDDTIHIAFRGTQMNIQSLSVDDILTDLRIPRVSVTDDDATAHNDYDATAHSGFVRDLDTVYSNIKDYVSENTRVSLKEDQKIHITGHSLGCGLGSVLAYRLRKLGYGLVQFYGFGCPPVGNEAFTSYLTENLIKSFAVKIDFDPISGTTAPLETLGYKSVRSEVSLGDPSNSVNPLTKHEIATYIEALHHIQ